MIAVPELLSHLSSPCCCTNICNMMLHLLHLLARCRVFCRLPSALLSSHLSGSTTFRINVAISAGLTQSALQRSHSASSSRSRVSVCLEAHSSVCSPHSGHVWQQVSKPCCWLLLSMPQLVHFALLSLRATSKYHSACVLWSVWVFASLA